MSHLNFDIDFLTSYGWEYDITKGFRKNAIGWVCLEVALDMQFRLEPETKEEYEAYDALPYSIATAYEDFLDARD